ncbi:hypothetical protein CPB97_005900 [Podila verticillata]|nr:hypothetical protein CPB97_005900 [Podila verticillata]
MPRRDPSLPLSRAKIATHPPLLNNVPTCMQHPRWVTLGCIILSIMLSCTMLMTQRNWYDSHSNTLDLDHEWTWPDMPTRALQQVQDDIDNTWQENNNPLINPAGVAISGMAGENESHDGIKTWDLNDPALTLSNFLESPAWINQSMLPGFDFVNLLRVLRPIPQGVTEEEEEEERQETTKTNNSPPSPPKYIKDHRVCGPWIQEYVEFQNMILEKSLPARYTIHACSKDSIPSDAGQACNGLFSQMVVMTSAFAWSVTESRGFFLRPDQVHGLQESFQSALFNHWTSPPKADNTATVNTEDLTTRDLERLFQLQDPLFENTGTSEMTGTDSLDDEHVLDRLRSLRSQSRNRITFERTLLPNDPVPTQLQQLVSTSTAAPLNSLDKGQRRLGRPSVTKMKKLMGGLEQDGVELILFHDLLPQFVNTTRTQQLFLKFGLPLPDSIIQNEERLAQVVSAKDACYPSNYIHGSFPPHFPHSTPSLGSSSKESHSLSTAFHAAIHDDRDVSRIHAVPKTFGCLLDILIQPHLALERLIHPYATLFQLPAVFSVGIYIKPSPTTITPSTWKTATEDRKVRAERYLTCARQIAREFAPKRKGQKVIFVVVSEDAKMAKIMEAQETWDEEMEQATHSSYYYYYHYEPKEKLSKSQQAVLDNWILSKTHYQVVSDHSDFAKVAVWRTRKAGRSIVVREQRRPQDHEPGFVDMLDCGALLRNTGVD